MSGKTAAAMTLIAFVFMSTSCMTWRTKTLTEASRPPSKKAKIVWVVRASGERVDFSKSDPGRFWGGAITGTAIARFSVPVEIEGPFPSIKKRADGTVYEITDRGGRVYAVQQVLKEGDAGWSVLINDRTPQTISIPLSDVRQFRSKTPNPFLTSVAIGVPLSLALLIVGFAHLLNE